MDPPHTLALNVDMCHCFPVNQLNEKLYEERGFIIFLCRTTHTIYYKFIYYLTNLIVVYTARIHFRPCSSKVKKYTKPSTMKQLGLLRLRRLRADSLAVVSPCFFALEQRRSVFWGHDTVGKRSQLAAASPCFFALEQRRSGFWGS